MATKLVRKPTTTKTSVGKETVNQTVARAKAMLGSAYDPNTKAPSASRMKEISEQSFIKPEVKKAYDKSVSATQLGNVDPVNLPVQEYGKDTGPINLAGSPVLSENGISVQDNQYVYDPKVSENMNAVNENAFSNQALLDSYMGKVNDAYDQTRNQEADYLKREKQAGIQKFQQQVNDYTSEINSIVKNRDAAMLSLEAQGRGQTTGFIGGEQARINREAAIAALSVQAQLDAAQGNLTSATARLDKLFAIHQQDIQNEFNFKTSLAKSVLDFGTAAQQNILTAKMADIKAATDLAMANNTYSKDLQKQALQNGQADLLSQFAAIDPKSPTFEQEIAKVASQLKDPMFALDMAEKQARIDATRVNTALNQQQLNDIRAKEKQITDSINSGKYILSEDQQDIAYKLNKDYVAQSGEFKKQVDAYNRIVASAEEPSAAGDLALIFNYMKILDPGSTVREGEFATAQNSGSIPSIIQAQYNKVIKGERLAEEQRSDFLDRSTRLYNGSLEQQISLENDTRDQAVNVYGLPEQAVNDIIRDVRATGALSDVVFGLQLNNASPEQLQILINDGLIPK